MNTLLLMRHGKAEAYHADGDKDRALVDRGLRDAQRVGSYISEIVSSLDLVVASDAQRAAQTARIAAESAEYGGEIVYKPEMYEASVEDLLTVVHSIPASCRTALLVGHNPSIEELCAEIAGMSAYDLTMPTCGLARLSITTEWSEAGAKSGKLAGFWSPKDL